MGVKAEEPEDEREDETDHHDVESTDGEYVDGAAVLEVGHDVSSSLGLFT